ncbi:hypothetical protein F5B22DRAFT_9323 [Xylaria bambusicola]|uniref:uncharacterized protein n=1 Tax=Xylaria bambusicola TaxID=326684 RepID=UPI002007B513|nr:uncharacterized protein F5B22DRAFT_9323 [Xylaria bambusicola]KAI0527893.1 hypothetical protein F5B22DRAFT_9323 [Xylaria bambusicola]
MAFKIFVIGVTGYIAGDALDALTRKYPGYEYAALVRSEASAARVREAYPGVRVVLGSLDDVESIRKEAAWADLVLDGADADHVVAMNAIVAGLVEGHSATRPGFWLHTSGTGIMTYSDTAQDRFGQPPDREFDDVDRLDEITSFPDEAFHRVTDRIVLECGAKYAQVVKTAIVCPPTIYGAGRGPVNTRSKQCPALANVILTKGQAPIIGTGQASSNNVHIGDVSEAFILLVEAAVSGNHSSEIWGARGYHVVGTEKHAWGPLARSMTAKARDLGLIKGDGEIQDYQMDKEEACKVAGWDGLSWGLNNVCNARRLKETLGWTSKYPTLEEDIPGTLKAEAKRMGLI